MNDDKIVVPPDALADWWNDQPQGVEDNLDFCPMCDATAAPMGTLGRRVHYRCRDCGMMWSHEPAQPVELSIVPDAPTVSPAGDTATSTKRD
jgi:hypothetical protein